MAKTTRKKEIATVIKDTLKPGTDKGSSQALIDIKDIEKAAENIDKMLPTEQPATNTQEMPPAGNGILDQKGMPVQDGKVASDPVPTSNIPAQPVVTQEIVTAQYKVELTKIRYQEALQGFASLIVTEENMKMVQEKMTAGRGLVTKMNNLKIKLKQPAYTICTFWDAAFNDLKAPLEQLLSKIQIDLNRVGAEQARKKAEADKEKERVDGIRTAIDNFILDQSQAIAGCKTAESLVSIEKFIGSHKANKTRYQEFLPDLIARSEELTTLIKSQKETIKQLAELEEKKRLAEAKNDDAGYISITEQEEALTARMEENKVIVQEKAIEQATKPGELITVTPIISTVQARRSKWKGELLTDQKSIEKAFKAGLLDFTINKDKIEVLINTLQETKQLDGKEELIINGVKLYLEKRY